jgi:Ca2+-binding RTX toxin-like protein
VSDQYFYYGTDEDDVLSGGELPSFVYGYDGDDTLSGGGDNDWLNGGPGADVLSGDAGDDGIYTGQPGEGNFASGGDGNDALMGSATDTLKGGDGVDYLSLDMRETTSGATIDLARLSNGGLLAFEDGTRASGFERGVLYLGMSGDRVTGLTGQFTIHGGGGDDTIVGRAGDDVVSGGSGDDVLRGGKGTDWVTFAEAARGVRVSLSRADPQNTHEGADTISGFENLGGSRFADRLVGDSGDNNISGGLADSSLRTGDSLYGGAGADTLEGGGSWAVFDGGAGDDWLAAADTTQGFTAANQTLVGGRGQDHLFLGTESVAVFQSVKDSSVAAPDHLAINTTFTSPIIDLQLIDADETADGDQAFLVVGAFTRHAGELVVEFRDARHETWILLDTDGDRRADAKIVIEGDHHDFDSFAL